MKLKDAITYYELTGTDFIADMNEYFEVLRAFDNGVVSNDFMDITERFIGNLTELSVVNQLSITEPKKLLEYYCHTIPREKVNEDEFKAVPLGDSSFKKKRSEENVVIKILSSFLANNTNIQQFFDIELELLLEIIEKANEINEESKKKNKRGLD